MTRTAVNVTGDSMVTLIVGKSEQQFDETVFNDLNAAQNIENIDFDNLQK